MNTCKLPAAFVAALLLSFSGAAVAQTAPKGGYQFRWPLPGLHASRAKPACSPAPSSAWIQIRHLMSYGSYWDTGFGGPWPTFVVPPGCSVLHFRLTATPSQTFDADGHPTSPLYPGDVVTGQLPVTQGDIIAVVGNSQLASPVCAGDCAPVVLTVDGVPYAVAAYTHPDPEIISACAVPGCTIEHSVSYGGGGQIWLRSDADPGVPPWVQ